MQEPCLIAGDVVMRLRDVHGFSIDSCGKKVSVRIDYPPTSNIFLQPVRSYQYVARVAHYVAYPKAEARHIIARLRELCYERLAVFDRNPFNGLSQDINLFETYPLLVNYEEEAGRD